jgi:predicted nucleic acid-binding protein
MADTILIDTNVLKDVSRGNEDVAKALKSNIQSGNKVYISKAAYDELTSPTPDPQRGAHYREMVKDLHIEVAPPGSLADRINFQADNDEVKREQNKPAPLNQWSGREQNRPGDSFVASQAKALGAKLWTLDKDMQKRAANLGVKLAPECSIKGISGVEDPNRGRQLLGLPKIDVNPQGQIVRKGPPGSIPGSGGSVPITIPPTPKGEAKISAMTIAFEGVNLVLDKINDHIQKQRVEQALDSEKSLISEARQKYPGYGIILMIVYRQVQAPSESLIKPGRVFDHIEWGKGATSDEAKRDAVKSKKLVQGLQKDEVYLQDECWIPPLTPENAAGARTPFPPVAVARFVVNSDNEATFQNVKFDTFQGFDDNWQTSRKLPDGTEPEFAILSPPSEVKWYNINGSQYVKVPLKAENSGNGTSVSVVDLDSFSPGSAAAAMIFPMNRDAELTFSTVPGTRHDGLLNHYINFGLVRWARAKNIKVVRSLGKK